MMGTVWQSIVKPVMTPKPFVTFQSCLGYDLIHNFLGAFVWAAEKLSPGEQKGEGENLLMEKRN